MSKVSFLGAGSWGTALAIMLANNGHEVTLWSAVESEVEMLQTHREHKDRLPGVKLPESVVVTSNLDKKEFKTYWADTSSNSLVGKLIQRGSPKIKKAMEKLLNGEYITVGIDEQIVFDQLDNDEDAIWSLLLASGYLKVDSMDICVSTGEQKYELSLTNLERNDCSSGT